jgi:hypothetical protein
VSATYGSARTPPIRFPGRPGRPKKDAHGHTLRHGKGGTERAPLAGTGNRCGAPKSDGSGPFPAPAAAPGRRCPFHDESPDARARMAQARRLGGKAPRVQAGLTPAVVEAIDLSAAEGQLAVLSAATRALASGQISSTTATAIAIATLVKAANQVLDGVDRARIAEMEAKIEQLVVEAPHGRR